MFLRTNKYRLLAYVEKGVGGAPEALGSGGLYIHTAIFIHSVVSRVTYNRIYVLT